jgi:AcrR family transcriptional regulator
MPVEDVRSLVIDAAVEEFGAVGRAASLDAIAKRAGVAKPSMYELFASKDDLYDAAVAAEVERMVDFLQARREGGDASDAVARTRGRIAGIFEFAEARPAGVRLLSSASGELRSAREAGVERVAVLIRSDLARVGVDLGPSADVLATIVVAMVLDVGRRTVEEGWPVDAIVDALTRFTLGGFAALDLDALRTLDEFLTE